MDYYESLSYWTAVAANSKPDKTSQISATKLSLLPDYSFSWLEQKLAISTTFRYLSQKNAHKFGPICPLYGPNSIE